MTSTTSSRKQEARIYLDMAEQILSKGRTEVGYNLPGRQFGEWWIDLFHSGALLTEASVEHAALSLCFMAAITERP